LDNKTKRPPGCRLFAPPPDIIAIAECPVLVRPLQPILRALAKGLAQWTSQAIGHVELFSGCGLLLLRHTAY
jgi:23S rRNA (uracil1939-C5)-methyltransferase